MKEAAMRTARLFRNGRSQAVRLPKDYALPGEEVFVKKIDGVVVLIPKEAGHVADRRHVADALINLPTGSYALWRGIARQRRNIRDLFSVV